MDKYLGKVGYEGQQTSVKKDPDHENNIWHPLPGDRGPHGTFGKEARKYSILLWIVTHKWLCWSSLFFVLVIILLYLWLF